MNLHVALNRPVTKSTALALCQLTCLLKAIQAMFHRKMTLIGSSVSSIIQNFSYSALLIIHSAKVFDASTCVLQFIKLCTCLERE
jgi:hypothetical protein